MEVKLLLVMIGFAIASVQGSYEKEGILQNTVSRVLEKVPILGQQLHQMRDTSCSICAKQALERCPMEIMKIKPNGTEPRVTFEEIHQVLQPNPHRFMGLMKNIVSKMHVQSKIDLDRARQKETKYRIKNFGEKVDKVVNTLAEIVKKR